MSGGVDSSVAAMLMKKQGARVTGMYMRLGIPGEDTSEAAARAVCRKLKIDFYPVNLETRFRQEVVDYFVESYKRGITPNPCVKCNALIKFGELLQRARGLGADYLATGHYINNLRFQISDLGFRYKLLRGADKDKDQSYFLYRLTQDQLRRVVFPLGKYTKDEVRALADKAGLPYIKKESQDVCFLKQDGKIIEHNEYLKQHIKLKPGPIIPLRPSATSPWQGEENGAVEVIGEHQGLPLYTIGQRRGIEVGGTGPYYAAAADYRTNTLWVVNTFDHPALFRDELVLTKVNWISGNEPKLPLQCEAVIRYGHTAVGCVVQRTNDEGRITKDKNKYSVKFKTPQRAVTPGQSVVFYDNDEVLGGGVIE